jgi:hypothetical protein
MKQLSRLSRELPYLLRIVILIIFFNGLLALITTLLSPFNDNGFAFDFRILNILIAFGLARKSRLGYVLGVFSVGNNIYVHIIRLLEFSFASTGIGFYFLTALAIDIFQFYTLLSGRVRAVYFVLKEQSEL